MLTKEMKNGYLYYYFIKALLFGNNFEEILQNIKIEDVEIDVFLLNYLCDYLKLNNELKLLNEFTKDKIQELCKVILEKCNNQDIKKYINNKINEIKMLLNVSELYNEKYYIYMEGKIKFGNKITSNNIDYYEPIISESINFDFLNYLKIVDSLVDIDENSYSQFDLLSIETFLYEIEEIESDLIFRENVQKISHYFQTIDKKLAKENNIPYKKVKEVKKQLKKILKRIK